MFNNYGHLINVEYTFDFCPQKIGVLKIFMLLKKLGNLRFFCLVISGRL
jgi:hypothetical protein